MASVRQKAATTLIQFYQKPVARVSMELTLSIGAIIFFAIFAIRPTLTTMADLVKEIEDKEALNDQLGQKIAALNTVQNEYFALQDRLLVLDQAIPNTPNVENVLKILEKTASDRNLIISGVQVQELPEDDPPDLGFDQRERTPIPMSVTVIGDYETIKQYVDDLQANRRTLTVESIVFSVKEEKDTRQLSAAITLNAHYFGQSTSTSNATQPTQDDELSEDDL